MDKQIEELKTPKKSSGGNLITIIISVIITALVAGGGVYAWQNTESKTIKQNLQNQLASSENQIETLQDEKRDLISRLGALEEENVNLEEENTSLAEEADAFEGVDFPIVIYDRAGLLNNTASGQAEKKQLEEKLINPFADYYNEDSIELVTLQITVPEQIGSPYEVKGIFKNGGFHGFLFGEREKEYGYWYPDCMGTCGLSEEFSAKYPEIAEIVD